MVTAHVKRPARTTSYKRSIVVLAVIAIAAYVVIPQLTGLNDSWSAVGDAKLSWMLLAVAGLVATYLLAAAMYLCLSLQRLPYGRTVLVQVASVFAGKVLPAGVGTLGVNYLYLRRQRQDAAQAGAAIAANNTLGFIGNGLLVLFMLLTTRTKLPGVHVQRMTIWIIVIVITLLLLGVVAARRSRPVRRFTTGLRALGQAVASYRRRPGKLFLALLCSVLLTLVYALILSVSTRAIGPSIPLGTAIIVMTIGVAGATVTPTPGGIGGAEAALAGALVLYHVPSTEAVAIAVVYRLVTYWLGLLLGGMALIQVRRRHYI